jgi:hypothetical protein
MTALWSPPHTGKVIPAPHRSRAQSRASHVKLCVRAAKSFGTPHW